MMNVGEAISVGGGVWRKGKHLWIETVCQGCSGTFLRRKDKSQSYCSEDCYWASVEERNKIDLAQKESDIIEGLLLSDGCVSMSKGNRNCFFTLTSTEEGFVDFVKGELSFDMKKTPLKARVCRASGKEYQGKIPFQIRSRARVTFTQFRETWYPNGTKVVPESVALSSESVLMWYLGDGSLDNGVGIQLCTDSFGEDDVRRLCDRLLSVGVRGAEPTRRNRILIPNRHAFEFFEYIGWDVPVMGYAHKWDTIVKESYFGRKCRGCGRAFDASGNHHHWCSGDCHKRDWNRRQRKLKTATA